MDVDGTLTDGKIYMGNAGEVMKVFSIKDGCGIHDILLPRGVVPVIMTGRCSDIVKNRAKEIGIDVVYQGVKDKCTKLKELVNDFSLVAYIGDDINDIQIMRAIKDAGGVVGCPLDAVEKVKAISDYMSSKNGGDGAVRDFIEWLIYNEMA